MIKMVDLDKPLFFKMADDYYIIENDPFEYGLNPIYIFHYRKIGFNKLGNWYKCYDWISTMTPLENVRV